MTTTPDAQQNQDQVTLTIDGKEVIANKGELLISAAQKAGVFIPRYCYHDRLEPVGMCRMCLVEIEGVRGMPPACTTPVSDGMVVHFQKDNVEKVQEGVLEFLLINHPLDCPTCDRAGECPLQDQTMSFGPGESRFVEEKRHWEKPIEISDHVLLDRERCIQCSRCVRFADDIAGDPLISFVERGATTEVNTFPGDEFSSHFSGNIVQICPVGALTAKPYRFSTRPWDLTSNETTCMRCSFGCKGVAQTSRNEMVRFLAVDSEPLNQGWLSDKCRYGFDYIHSDNRIRVPFIKKDEDIVDTSLPTVIDATTKAISDALKEYGPSSIAFLGGAHGTNEDAYALSKLAKGVIGTHMVDSQMGNSLPADLIFSSQRARISDMDDASAIITLGVNVKDAFPSIYLRIRKAVTQNKVPLIEVDQYKSSLATKHIDLVPGDEKAILKELLEVLEEITNNNSGKVVLITGDINPAQDRSSFIDLVSALCSHKDVRLLPAIAPSNIMGAYEMGLAPGLLPGRVSDISTEQIPTWSCVPELAGAYATSDTVSILNEVIKGNVKVLVLVGANPIAHCSDQELAQKALEVCETIIAVDGFINESTQYADIFIPCTLANEKDGTVTNIEGRVQRVVQVVAPQGGVYDDWKIWSMVAQQLGCYSDYEVVDDVTNDIAHVAASFAHLTTNVLVRARDGVIVPVDDNKDVLVTSSQAMVDTPSWEPIASKAHIEQDPMVELEHEEHHPSANVHFAQVISQPFDRGTSHSHHLDKYSLRLVFVENLHRDSTLTRNSSALGTVSAKRFSTAVHVHPKDFESFDLSDSNTLILQNDKGSVEVEVIGDPNVMRSVTLTSMSSSNALRKLIDVDNGVTDLRVEAKS